MPILHWLTREHDLHLSGKAPYRLLEHVETYGDENNENMLIQGDNLDALKALLPYYAGKVKCIYIDPPYNTKSAFEHYDDNLEHSVWLSMMYPRLELLRELLSEDGSMWVNLDDNEAHYAKVILDEIFGRKNFISNVIWQKKYSPQNDAKWLSDNHDHILVYAKNKNIWRPNLLPRSEEMNKRYKNLDNDPRGDWKSSDLSVKTYNAKTDYPITTPSGRIVHPPKGYCWRVSMEKFQEMVLDNRIHFGSEGNSVPSIKRFLTDVKQGITSMTIWTYNEVGHNQDAKKEIKQFNDEDVFDTPKPERLLQRIYQLATEEDDIVLDSFLGSGTSAAVAHKMGRKYIGIELGNHINTHCIPRLEKVISSEDFGGISQTQKENPKLSLCKSCKEVLCDECNDKNGSSAKAEQVWFGGGGFRFYKLGDPIFEEDGSIRDGISFAHLAAHIWFAETGLPMQEKANSPCLGIHEGTAYYLLYNGILKDKSVNGGNVLTKALLQDLQVHDGKKVIYGERSLLSPQRLKEMDIEFKQTPYDIKGR